jgi:hypothetical protein
MLIGILKVNEFLEHQKGKKQKASYQKIANYLKISVGLVVRVVKKHSIK